MYLPAAATVVLRCNVTDPADFMNFMDPVWNTIEVTYSDSDGMPNDSRVLVQLVRVGKATGVGFLTGTFDSNSFAGGAGTLLNSAGFFHMFDFTNFGVLSPDHPDPHHGRGRYAHPPRALALIAASPSTHCARQADLKVGLYAYPMSPSMVSV